MVSGANVITIDPLDLDGDILSAGVVDAGEARFDGSISVAGNSMLSGATDNSRDLRILSPISGSALVELSAPSHTIYIDNTNNTFNGTWVISGGTGEFSGNQAVGSASIEVQSAGALRILGDWQGLAKNDSLTVADTATASVDLGPNNWTVASLEFGGSPVADKTYTAAELNALGANAVFTGSGTIQVGPPPPPPQPPILVGWERWVGGAGSLCPATVETNGFTGVATNTGGFAASRFGASNDGTFGTLLLPPASSDTSVNEEGMRVTSAASDLPLDFSIDNTSGSDVELGIFHFDALTKTVVNGSPMWTLEVVSGGITVGVVSNAAVGFVGGTTNLDDYDVDLTGLADHTLEAGGNVVFRLTFSGFAGATNSKMDVDNIALTEVLSTVPSEQPIIEVSISGGDLTVSWLEAGFRLQTRPNLVIGDWADYPGGTSSPVIVPATNEVEFLRLVYP
jgi:hypothetical protein